MDPVYGYQVTNVEASMSSPSSLLHWTRRMIEIRKQNPAFGLGSYTELPSSNPAVLAFLREYEDDLVLCVHNFSRFAQPTELDLSRFGGRHPVELFGGVRFPAIGELPYLLTLAGARLLLVPAAPDRDVARARVVRCGVSTAPPGARISNTPTTPGERTDAHGGNGHPFRHHRFTLASLDPLLRTWLPRQRWFAGKGAVTGFTPVSVTELLPPDGRLGLYHLLLRVHQPAAPGAPPHPGDCYQLLIGVREALPPRLAPALIGHVTEGPLAGRTVYDALYDPRPAEVLLEAPAHPGPHRRPALSSGTLDRRLGGPGGPADDRRTVQLVGGLWRYVHSEAVAPGRARRQPRSGAAPRPGSRGLPPGARADGLAARRGRHADVCAGRAPAVRERRGRRLGAELRELAKGEDFAAEARALGRATAEVHTALARALPTVTLGHAQLEALVDGMTERLTAAVQAVPALLPYEPGLRSAYRALGTLAAEGRTWTAQRVHGDLHLGQCLRSPSGNWSLIDFEGEPARPLAERRMPQPPVRDIAGMLRSFDYAAHSASPPAHDWAHACRAAYRSGYAEVAGRDPRTDPVLLRAFETDKAVYEVVYEARHRPDWLPVPLSAVRRLALPDQGGSSVTPKAPKESKAQKEATARKKAAARKAPAREVPRRHRRPPRRPWCPRPSTPATVRGCAPAPTTTRIPCRARTRSRAGSPSARSARTRGRSPWSRASCGRSCTTTATASSPACSRSPRCPPTGCW